MTLLFVTASGTDVGKTFVCRRLIEELAGGFRLRVLKPVATGFDPADVAATDTGALLAAQGKPLDADAVAATTPWRFRAALSPDMAAAREGRGIEYERLVEFCRPAPDAELTLIEGVGGVMVPLDSSHTVLDWIAALDPLVWLVVGSYLGTLSHTLTALAALDARGLDVGAVIVSESAGQPVPAAETAAVLARFMGEVPIRVLPRPPAATTRLLAPLIEPRLTALAARRSSRQPPGARK